VGLEAVEGLVSSMTSNFTQEWLFRVPGHLMMNINVGKAIQENKMDVINTNWNSISIQELAIPTLILATHQIYIST
jgi:hypothetical protein